MYVMKLIIVEGPDHTGKSRIISNLLEQFETATIIHCTRPKSNLFKDFDQDMLFDKYISNIVDGVYDTVDVVIMNRSYYGEYVYGMLYRNRNEYSVKQMIHELDEKLSSRKDLMVKYILLTSSKPEFLINNEDGKSLSNKDISNINNELRLFDTIFDASILSKKKICVNDGMSFRNIDNIMQSIYEFL